MRKRIMYTWWLNSALRWRLAPVRDWFLQIWFCHHNARVLADMEYRLGCVLSATTRGMSKAYYTWPAMEQEIYGYQQDIGEQAVKDFKEDYDCHCDERECQTCGDVSLTCPH